MAKSTDEPTPAPEPESTYDPETQVATADGEVVAMPSGSWRAALTESGNLRRSKGLLVQA